MQVFKAYLKVLRATRTFMIINLCIFLSLAVLFSFMASQNPVFSFEMTKTPIAVVNRDGDETIACGLVDYLSSQASVKLFPDDEEVLQDALFYREVEYIAIIPQGFSEEFLAGGTPILKKVVVPGSTSSFYVDIGVDRFLNTLRLYREYGGGDSQFSQDELVAATVETLQFDTPVALDTSKDTSGGPANYSYYYAYCAYALLSLVMGGISSIMIAFNQRDLRLRNLCAPISRRTMNLQLAMGHSVFALTCWAALIVLSLVLYGKQVISSNLIGLYALNTLAFTAVCVSIGFLAGSTVKSHGAQAGAVNGVSLAICFLGGVFVPQSVMSESVLAAARFLPGYWFIRANDAIGWLQGYLGARSSTVMAPIYHSVLIQVGFAAVVFGVGLLFSRDRSQSQV